MTSEKITDVVRSLVSILEDQRKILKKIRLMSAQERREIFEAMSQTSRFLLTSGDQIEIPVKILQSISSSDLKFYLEQVPRDVQTGILRALDDETRVIILDSMGYANRKRARNTIKDYQEWEMVIWSKVSPVWVVIDKFPDHYLKNMRKCVECGDDYAILAAIIAADCGKHGFHKDCETWDGSCPECL